MSGLTDTAIRNYELGNRYPNKKQLRKIADALKGQIDELMRQYADEEIDSDTYAQKMMELTTSNQKEKN